MSPQSTATAPASSTGTGRVAVVTGGSRGIGRACAVRLGRDGYSVVLNYAANAEEAQKALAEIHEAGGLAVAVQGDVGDEHAMAAVFDRAEAEFGGVDTLVHAAGRMPLARIVDLDLDVLDSVHRTNIRGTFVVDQLAARRLRRGGSIINFSTSVVGTSFPAYGAYAASKGAVEALTMILARELRGRDVTVNAVAPGPTATDLFLDGKSDEQVQQLAHAVPLERLGQPSDIADIVAFLAGPAGHWINGQVIRANGGLV
jgi:3-oxoacyl-[acyl-carrier protein] reductase